MRPLHRAILPLCLGLLSSLSMGQNLAVQERGRLLGAGLDPGDQSGSAVCISGDTLVLGAPFDSDAFAQAGAAYVFVESSSGWIEEAKLGASDAAAFSTFGEALSLSGDTLIVGASGDGENGSFAGAAYVFTRTGSSWTQEAKLLANDGAANDLFGFAVALDGDTAVVGAWLDDDAGTSSGSAYVFVRTGGLWSQQAKLLSTDLADRDNFGEVVAISGDTIVCGARHDDDDGLSSGSAYAFVRSGNNWNQQTKFVASDGASFDTFGCSVAISGDTALVGACLEDEGGMNAGAAYVFQRSGGSWSQQAKLLAEDASGGDRFGSALSIDGESALIGASFADLSAPAVVAAGAAYVFQRSAFFFWNQQFKLSASDAGADDRFGESVFLDGERFAVGAGLWDDESTSSLDNGTAYAFQRGPAASVVARQGGSNPNSLDADDPVLGASLQVTVDLGTTGHSSAALYAYSAPANLSLSGGQVLLVGGVQLFKLPLSSGGQVVFDAQVPNDLALLGATIHLQALHLLGVQPFALSNALELSAGF